MKLLTNVILTNIDSRRLRVLCLIKSLPCVDIIDLESNTLVKHPNTVRALVSSSHYLEVVNINRNYEVAYGCLEIS